MEESRHILVADDEPALLQTITELLRRKGYTCNCAPNAEAALELVERESFDLLLSDIKMPGNQHLELVKQWEQHVPGAPVILMTAYPAVESAIRAIQLPVVAYLVKPFRFQALLDEIRRALTRAQAVRRAQSGQSALQARQGEGPSGDES